MLFSGKNIIVTGATGDLGVAIVQRLISQGANVLAVAGHQSEISRLAPFSGPGRLETSVADAPTPDRCLATPHAPSHCGAKSTASSTMQEFKPPCAR